MTALIGATAGGATPTALTFNAVSVPPAPGDPQAEACSTLFVPTFWTSGGALHVRNFPTFAYLDGTTSEGGVIGGTGCTSWNANLRPANCLDFGSPNFGLCDGDEWGTATNVLTLNGQPLGTWSGRYTGTLADGAASGG